MLKFEPNDFCGEKFTCTDCFVPKFRGFLFSFSLSLARSKLFTVQADIFFQGAKLSCSVAMTSY